MRTPRFARRVAVWAVSCLSLAAAAGGFEGDVVGVADGDTLTVLVGERREVVRLVGIDAPERGQPWSRASKNALSRRVMHERVEIDREGTDRYGRTLGWVQHAGGAVNLELVRAGHAWVYRRYTDDPALLDAEREAREGGRGLWGLPHAERVAPWEWRASMRAAAASRVRATDPLPEGCDARVTCADLPGCRDARYALTVCGLTHLDGDGDGTPCEDLCR